jgi:hypothetical protein
MPAFMVGMDNTIDIVPDADTPEKLMKLYGKEKENENKREL